MDPKLLSICTTVKNRSRVQVGGRELRLFPNCVDSIVRARGVKINLELVVADWESDDWPLAEWLRDAAHPIPVRVSTLSGTFSRGRGLNVAAKAALGDCLFFLDSDALVGEDVLEWGIATVRKGNAYFPVPYSFNDPEHRSGYWRHSGFGHCMLSKQAFDNLGGWPEYSSWGSEDDFWGKVKASLPVVREEVSGFYHQWHPDDIDFKNRYGEESDTVRRARARAQQGKLETEAIQRLREILPSGARYILVDEDRSDIKDGIESRAVPFLEKDGEYWGPPSDDIHAIRELERMRREGAEFIVFPWITFWWLEYYGEFAEHLVRSGRCLQRDDLMTVYQLHRPSAADRRHTSATC